MGLATFKGGIHPYEGKELSENKPIQVLLPKGELVFPMSQHIGAPAKPLVAKGDRVLAGQKIGEAGGFISANVICSVSGTVKAIEPRRMVNGAMVPSIIVENDGEYETVEGVGEDRDPSTLSKEEIRSIVKEAGIVGLGGAGFPTHVKLTPKDENAIDYVIVNGAECEPYLTSDYRMLIEEPEKIVGGLKVILQLFDNAKGVIAIENNKPEAIKKLTEMVKDEPKITVCPLLTKYPQGGERSIIYAVTGRKVNSSMLPADAGCIVDNVDTDVIIPARYLNSSDPAELAAHCMEDIDKDFIKNVKKGDIIVADKNFGCGSSREHAPIAIKAAGVSCVIAETFARIFYRNAINIGLPIIECKEAAREIENGDEVSVNFDTGVITDITKNTTYQGQAFPEFMQKIIAAEGLVNYINQK